MPRSLSGGFMFAALAVSLFVVGSESAQAQQSLVFNFGQFSVRGEDTRVVDDVLLENLTLFAFDIRDFNSMNTGVEWLISAGEYFDAGLGVGFYQRTVPSVYTDFINDDGSELFQDFRLRVVPLTAIIRVIPFGRNTAVQPYFGVGVGLFNWRYSEVGEFIDFDTFDVFHGRFTASGRNVGGLMLGGFRVPVGDRFSAGLEVRYQSAIGRVGLDQGFLNERIDLGGIAAQVTFQVDF